MMVRRPRPTSNGLEAAQGAEERESIGRTPEHEHGVVERRGSGRSLDYSDAGGSWWALEAARVDAGAVLARREEDGAASSGRRSHAGRKAGMAIGQALPQQGAFGFGIGLLVVGSGFIRHIGLGMVMGDPIAMIVRGLVNVRRNLGPALMPVLCGGRRLRIRASPAHAGACPPARRCGAQTTSWPRASSSRRGAGSGSTGCSTIRS